MAKKKRRVVRRKQPQSIISDEITIPNHSGMLDAGEVHRTPTDNLDPVNKKYVDDEIDNKIEDGTSAGQMAFWNGTKWVKTETSELFFDKANGRFGIGTAIPSDSIIDVHQLADDEGIITRGYDDKSGNSLKYYVDQWGQGIFKSTWNFALSGGGTLILDANIANSVLSVRASAFEFGKWHNKNSPFKLYGVITAAGSGVQKYAQLQVNDTNDKLCLTRQDTNILGFDIDMPVTITTTTGALTLPRMTTTQRNALTAVNGMILYNTTLNKVQVYEGGAWASVI